MTSLDIALRFVARINAHDADGLIGLMSAHHAFIDSLGNISMRPAIEEGWRQYFDMVPDYWIRIGEKFSIGQTAILTGMAGGTYVPKAGAIRSENKWETPAVWVAHVEGKKVSEWRIYSDNEPIREKMRKSSS